MANIGCGIMDQSSALFSKVITVGAYTAVFHTTAHWRPWTFDQHWTVWVAAFVLSDFAYYWAHRTAHEVNIFWIGHVVHHQSEDYNLAVALRQALFSSLTSLPFYLPLALLGVPPLVFGTCNALNTLYQFWIHTELIRTLPKPVEAVMNTPSHHRVHHGTNPQYLDRNHAGVFIIWDKLFGTFEPEDEEVVYGLVTPLGSFNPLWANFVHLVGIAQLARASETLQEKFQALFAGPAWRPVALGGPKQAPAVSRASQQKYDPTYNPSLGRYVGAWFLLTLPWSIWLMAVGQQLPLAPRTLAAGWVLWTVTQLGVLLDGRPWAQNGERLRLLATVGLGAAVALTSSPAAPALGAMMAAAGALSLLWWARR